MKTDLSITHEQAATRALPITLAFLALVLLPHAIVYRENAFSAYVAATGWGLAAGLLVASIVAHEVLHAVAAMVFGDLKWSDISYGVRWKTLTAYAHPRVAMTARAYRAVTAAPGVLLGIVPAIAGLATGNGALSGYGALMLAAAAGDALIIWSLRGTPDDARVQDHPSRVGCHVVREDEESTLVDEPHETLSEGTLMRWTRNAFLAGVGAGAGAGIVAYLN